VVKLTFQPARCGYTLRVTSKTLYSPEYITSKHTQKNIYYVSEMSLYRYLLSTQSCFMTSCIDNVISCIH
jgi:hypothetical protein